MLDFINEYIDNLKELWLGLDKKARLIIPIGTIAILIILGYLIFSGNGTVYTPLYTNIVSEDASEIVNSLQEKNIPYRLTNGGSTIEVSKNDVHQIRLDLASEGLPNQGVVGFEIFDESQFGVTDFERKVNYYRAVGGELSRSIRVMNGVEFAKVQITAPKESIYLEKNKAATASVLLKLEPGFRIDSSHVDSITNLVASSVQDLSPEAVTVIDTKGNLLSSLSTDNGFNNQQSKENLSVEKNFEISLENDLKSLLTKVLGPDNFSVNVNAKLNFDQREVESTTYSPVVDGEGIVRSQEVLEENNEVNNASAAGAAGTESNIPEYQGELEESQSSNYEKENTITNYEINEKIERHIYASGDVEKLTVSVMVNNLDDQALLDKIEQSVQTAIGFSEQRGDQVTVNSFNFDDSLEKEIAEVQEAEASSQKQRMYIYVGLIVLIIIILIVLIFMIKKSYSSSNVKRGQIVDYQTDNEDLDSDKLDKTSLTEAEKQKKKLKEELEDVVANQPEDVAKLLKNWLMED